MTTDRQTNKFFDIINGFFDDLMIYWCWRDTQTITVLNHHPDVEKDVQNTQYDLNAELDNY